MAALLRNLQSIWSMFERRGFFFFSQSRIYKPGRWAGVKKELAEEMYKHLQVPN